ncbi:MAG: hypothetical protein JRI25_20010 [Deltaproteobacteria bacterium]|nr:hypothetical protein [Deltaproteobacteria bacterium]
MLVLLALTLMTAQAGECDVLRTAVEEATSATVATAWAKLAACDRDAALATADMTFETALPGSDAHDAIHRGIELGLEEQVRAYLRRVPPDHRSKAIGTLGRSCDETPTIADFFVASYQAMGTAFWSERWHRGLAGCRTEEVRALLTQALEGDVVGIGSLDRGLFFSVLEVYARNMQGDALPTLQALALKLEEEEEVTYVINAFSDAAGVGSLQGLDREVTEQAVSALEQLGPDLPARGVDQARTTLLALDAEEAADRYAKYRWPAAYRLGGYRYRYAAVAVERVTCKNGKQMAILHHADFTEPGNLWPDQLPALIPEKLTLEWRLDGSNLCPGEHEVAFALPWAPFQTDEDRATWLHEQRTAYRESSSRQRSAVSNQPVGSG